MADLVTQFAATEGVSRDNFNSRISRINSGFSGLQTDVKIAQSTANTAKSNAAKAQTTANTAVSKADVAKTAANTAQSTANNKAPIATPIFTGTVTAPILRLTSTGDASESSTGHALQIGRTTDYNVIMDINEIIGRRNGVISPVYINGTLTIGASTTDYTTYRARNLAAGTGAMTAGSTALGNGNIYLQYE